MLRYFFVLSILVTIFSCSKNIENQSNNDNSISVFKIENYNLSPKKSFELNSIIKSDGDTLYLATCSDFAFYPFGKLIDKGSLSGSLLNKFKIVNYKRDTISLHKNLQWSESIDLEYRNNKLNLYFDNDPEASKHGYITDGEINSDDVILKNNIKIGITSKYFFEKFFNNFPSKLSQKYKVIILESCVTDIIHIYTFKNGNLDNIKFISQ